MNKREVKALQAVAGSLSWVAWQCRPDEAGTASILLARRQLRGEEEEEDEAEEKDEEDEIVATVPGRWSWNGSLVLIVDAPVPLFVEALVELTLLVPLERILQWSSCRLFLVSVQAVTVFSGMNFEGAEELDDVPWL